MKLYLLMLTIMACVFTFGMSKVVADYKVMSQKYTKATECVASYVREGIERKNIIIKGDSCETIYSSGRNN